MNLKPTPTPTVTTELALPQQHKNTLSQKKKYYAYNFHMWADTRANLLSPEVTGTIKFNLPAYMQTSLLYMLLNLH